MIKPIEIRVGEIIIEEMGKAKDEQVKHEKEMLRLLARSKK